MSSWTERRTSMPLVLTARTSARVSYWPWSASPRTVEPSRRPVRVIWMPISTSCRGSSQLTSLGPATPTDLDRSPAWSSWARALARGTVSSWRTQTQLDEASAGTGSASMPRSMARPIGTRASRRMTSTDSIARRTPVWAWAMAFDESLLATSTMTSRAGGSVWAARPSRHCASHVAPLCTTTIASTVTSGRCPVEGGADNDTDDALPAGAGVPGTSASSSGTAATFTRTPAGRRVRTSRSDRALLQLAALSLGQSAPDAEPLVIGQGVLEALGPHLATDADLLGLARGAALLREERLRVGLGAERPLLPGELTLLLTRVRPNHHQLVHDPSSTLTAPLCQHLHRAAPPSGRLGHDDPQAPSHVTPTDNNNGITCVSYPSRQASW